MGLEIMRRWPVFVVFALCLLLFVSLFSSWTNESELQVKMAEIQIQLQDCSRQHASCLEESLTLVEQRDGYVAKLGQQDKEKAQLKTMASDAKQKAALKETEVNQTLVDVAFCKTELQSLKNLQETTAATLKSLRLKEETLTTELAERRLRIEFLEKEVARLKAPDAKTPPNFLPPSKVTPAPSPAKQSQDAVLGAPNQALIENNAKEDTEDLNTVNDNNFNDFDGNKK